MYFYVRKIQRNTRKEQPTLDETHMGAGSMQQLVYGDICCSCLGTAGFKTMYLFEEIDVGKMFFVPGLNSIKMSILSDKYQL